MCVAVPRYECQPVLREVPDTQCEDETYQKCYKVPNQVTHRRTESRSNGVGDSIETTKGNTEQTM